MNFFIISCIVLWISIPTTIVLYLNKNNTNNNFYLKVFFTISLLFSFFALTTGKPPALDISDWFSEPDLSVPYDLDCIDIQQEIWVGDYDPHGLDRDGDGWGCESYGN